MQSDCIVLCVCVWGGDSVHLEYQFSSFRGTGSSILGLAFVESPRELYKDNESIFQKWRRFYLETKWDVHRNYLRILLISTIRSVLMSCVCKARVSDDFRPLLQFLTA